MFKYNENLTSYMVKSRENLVGAYAFLIGIILAVILGLSTQTLTKPNTIFYIILVALGVIIGYLNSGDRESMSFLFASIAIVIVGSQGNATLVFMSNISPVLSILNNVLRALLVLFIPATVIAALKVVLATTKI